MTATGSTATVSYDSNFPVGGFQFNVAGVTLTDVTSGLADAQFNASTGVVIGFDFSGTTLPAGSGVLAELSFNEVNGGSTLALSNATVSSGSGDVLLSGGSASDSVPACTEDCAGICSGTTVVDDCGDCGGSNACHTGSLSLGAFDSDAGTLEVNYDFGADVAGFQFEVSGLALDGGSGGAADAAGFDVDTGRSTLHGF